MESIYSWTASYMMNVQVSYHQILTKFSRMIQTKNHEIQDFVHYTVQDTLLWKKTLQRLNLNQKHWLKYERRRTLCRQVCFSQFQR